MRGWASLVLVLVACNEGDGKTTETTLALTLPDEDGDTIMDHHEGLAPLEGEDAPWHDFDEDGIPNYQDLDSDGDGLSDEIEAGDIDPITFPFDSDNDGMADFVDLDADGNCLEDGVEGDGDIDMDAVPDFADTDDDGDLISDAVEIGLGCDFPDHDGDGVPDYHDPDSDDDGIADVYEGGTTAFDETPVDHDGDGTPDYLDDDSDDDGLPDSAERGDNEIFEPPRDTDNDGVADFADSDSDNDGLSDRAEVELGTDVLSDDTDGDGFTDGAEHAVGSDPLNAADGIEGIYVEVPARTDVEEQFQFELAIEQGDVAFIIDTTCSMGGLLNAISNEFAQIVTDISAAIPDAQYGVATFDDYNYPGMGGANDLPYILRQQVTDNTARVQTVLGGLVVNDGGDLPESATEALYQALSGAGYDQNCNGTFDSSQDVRPFLASASDPFAGAGGELYDSTATGGGMVGGMGFRPYALPILVYATDAAMRNPATHPSPGGCPEDASGVSVTDAADALGAYLIGVHVNGNAAQSQMMDLAVATGSYADADGDGVADDPLVTGWSGASAGFRTSIVDAVDDLVGSVVFDEVTLQVVGDDQGFVIDIEPEVFVPSGSIEGELLEFTLTFRGTDAPAAEDQLHVLTLNVIGDGTVLLDTLDVYVLVPGTSL
jgi:hypothetical protein